MASRLGVRVCASLHWGSSFLPPHRAKEDPQQIPQRNRLLADLPCFCQNQDFAGNVRLWAQDLGRPPSPAWGGVGVALGFLPLAGSRDCHFYPALFRSILRYVPPEKLVSFV